MRNINAYLDAYREALDYNGNPAIVSGETQINIIRAILQNGFNDKFLFLKQIVGNTSVIKIAWQDGTPKNLVKVILDDFSGRDMSTGHIRLYYITPHELIYAGDDKGPLISPPHGYNKLIMLPCDMYEYDRLITKQGWKDCFAIYERRHHIHIRYLDFIDNRISRTAMDELIEISNSLSL